MANTTQTQAFYAMTLQQPSAVSGAVICNAIPNTRNNEQQIVEARGQRLLLHSYKHGPTDQNTRRFTTVVDHNVFGIIRGVSAFRIPGTLADQLVVATDSGRITMLAYDNEKHRFERIALETFGKSGVRRSIPGQYVACDPRGRCVMLASTEKNKVVYFLNRDSKGKVIISSPHEANTWATLTFDLVAVDPGWESPVFAALEVDYTESEQDPSGEAYTRREKQLVYYTVDLGLNHVVKNWSEPVDYTAHKLFAVPGGQDGPSGVLVCAEERIYYLHDKAMPLMIPIPRRKGPTEDASRKRHIVAGCVHHNKTRHTFFFLLQTEDGDTFKLTMVMELDEEDRQTSTVDHMVLKYYDTFPVASQMVLHRKGFLYIGAENGQSKIFHVDDLAENDEFEPYNTFTSLEHSPDPSDSYEPTYFQPRELTMTHVYQTLSGLHPLMRCKVDNPLNEDAPQIYALQGTGNQSQFKTLRHGLEIETIVNNPLGNVPYDNIWTFKHRRSDDTHQYLLVSSNYGDLTVVCSIGDSVEQLENSGFLGNRATVHAQLIGDSTLIQVHARGVRSITENGKIDEWNSPANRTIVTAAGNAQQMLLALSSAELVYFFMDSTGDLNTLEDMVEMEGKVTAIGLAPTPTGRMQAKYAVVGCDDCTIRVLSIETDSPLESRSIQGLTAIPHSIEIVESLDPDSGTSVNVVHIGLRSGLYLRATLDETTGDLGDVRPKFLGSRPPRFFPVQMEEQKCVLACSSRPWLGYNHPRTGYYTTTPLISSQFEAAKSFISNELKGICAIQGSSLLIFQIPSLSGRLACDSIDLSYTPRGMSRHPDYPLWYVVQSDGNTLSKATRNALRAKVKSEDGVKMEVDGDEAGDQSEAQAVPPDAYDEKALAMEKHLGLPRGEKHWASCIQIVDPITRKDVLSTIELTENEAALCCTCVAFESQNWETYLAVGTGQHMSPGSQQPTVGFVHIYRILEDGSGLELAHKTQFAAPIYALLPFRGRLALGVANELFIYDMGTTRLLRKSRGTVVPKMIVTLDSQGNRLVCGDVSESVTYVVFKARFNRMVPFVDDSISRWTTTASMVDYETTAGGDKFGNLWLLRCPSQPSREADEEGAGGFIMNERSYLNGTPHRLELRAHYFCQDIPMSVQKTPLVAGGVDVIFWAGLQGTLGILAPFVTREDVEFFTSLELHMRTHDPPLAGRDHLLFRSYYVPVKGVIDGDLCERFLQLSYDDKQRVAAETGKQVKDVEKKIQEMRTRVAF